MKNTVRFMIGWEIHERRDAMKEYVVWFEALGMADVITV
jgi:hypothetical protein